ncbi:hypothetical protein PV05_10049 [Exophiala xenobiotica]|uniref:Uncharacterized protein n=1 Tax=Exophiala xenobiotica TaxID=348802 RepID=A0A0D2E9H3_9EURO|nr:uncharacterized protein PV05_10049 [Exophiala xenobiotica]KIW51315.1 hypothetical protein PV05_10049 [Exophiala xenobiotica]
MPTDTARIISASSENEAINISELTSREDDQDKNVALQPQVAQNKGPAQTETNQSSEALQERAPADSTMAAASDPSTADVASEQGTYKTSLGDVESQLTREGTMKAGSDIRLAIRQDLHAGKIDIPVFKGQKHFDLTAPPPGTYQFPPPWLPPYRSRFRQQFDRSYLLPDRNLPFNIQIMEHVKDWAELGSRIEDDSRRKEVLDRVFVTLQNAWFEALRLGYDPGVPTDGSPKRRQRAPAAAEAVKKQLIPGQPPTPLRSRQKKDVDPAKVPIFVSQSYRGSHLWAVTAGELEEAGVSEARIRRRAEGDLDDGDELLEEVLEEVGGILYKEDWFRTPEANSCERDLFLYSLFEVQMSRRSLAELQALYDGFSGRQQKVNTQKRIDAEKERHNHFLALALEINGRGGSKSPQPSDNNYQEGRGDDPESGDQHESASLADALVNTVEKVVNEPNVGTIVSLLDSSGFSEDLFATDQSLQDASSNLDKTKQALRDLMVHARQIDSLSTDAGQGDDLHANLQVCAQAEDLAKKVEESKNILANLLSSLKSQPGRSDVEGHGTDIGTGDSQLDPILAVPTNENLTSGGHSSGQMCEPTHSDNALKRAHSPEEADDDTSEVPAHKKQKIEAQAQNEAQPQMSLVASEVGDINTPTAPAERPASPRPLETPGANLAERKEEIGKRSLVVKLRVPNSFDPTELTSEKVFFQKGFRYRYTRSSTIAQRRAMDEALDSFVRGKRLDGNWRFGRYEALCDPKDPERTTIIHGIWDNKDGTRAEGSEWFHDGNGDCRPPLIEHVGRRVIEGVDDEEPPDPGHQGHEPIIVNKHHKNVLKLTISKRNNANIGKRRKEQPKRRARTSALPTSPLSQSVSVSSTRATRSASTNKPRPKRQTAKRTTYGYDGDGGSDDEFVP